MGATTTENPYNLYSYYQDLVIFALILIVQSALFVIRRFKFDPSAIITLLSYLFVIFSRFLRSVLSGKDRQNPVQTAISIFLNIIVSMTMYHFVFEMKAVQI